MRLKKLELSGFKSFMERTAFFFEPGITAVVGPNGCGKSNIVDAIRWAMGEQSAKAMRSRLMEDVIFNGSETHPPMGMTEVTLTFENTNGHAPAHLADCTEIEISRRLFRSGESEYAINRVPCRRKDIWELFMDTGMGNRSYAIVEQDRVFRIIHAKPEERRVIIEEVAGISKYKSRREEAKRKMEATRQNLMRIQDVRREIGHQIQSLERQAKKAQQYKDIRREIFELEKGILLRKWSSLNAQRAGLDNGCGQLEAQRDALMVELQASETSLQEDRLGVVQRERDLSESQQVMLGMEREVRGLETSLQSKAQEIESLRRLKGVLLEELEGFERRIREAEQEEGRFREEGRKLAEQRKESASQIQRLNSSLLELQERHSGLQEELARSKNQLVEWLSERATLNNSMHHHQRQMLEMDRFLERHRAVEATLEDRLRETGRSVEEAESRIAEAERELASVEKRRVGLAEQIGESQRELAIWNARVEEARGAAQSIRSKLQSLRELQEGLEGFGEGVKRLRFSNHEGEVLRGKKLKILAEAIDVADGMVPALEGLLGERLQYFLVESPREALEALAYARDRGLGRVGFIPFAQRRSASRPHTTPQRPDHAGDLWESISVEPGYEGIKEALLEGVSLVKSADRAVEQWERNGHRIFLSRSGEVLHPSGILEGGDRKDASGGFLRRKREIQKLEKTLWDIEKRLSEYEARAGELQGEVESLSGELERVSRRIHELETDCAESQKALDVARESFEGARQRLELLHWEMEERVQERERIAGMLDTEGNRLAELEKRIGEAEKRVGAQERETAERREAIEGLQHALTQARVGEVSTRERMESLQRELARLVLQIDELKEGRDRKRQQLCDGDLRAKGLEEEIEREKELLQERMLAHQKARETAEGFRAELEAARLGIQEKERICQSVRVKQRDLEHRLHEIQLQRREIALNMEYIERELAGRFEMAPDQIPKAAEKQPDRSPHEEERRLALLKNSLEKIGDVNLMAVEQYEELQERYAFLTGQQEDLERSIRSLAQAIKRINRSSRRRFRQAFAAMDAQFQKVFPILFNGGEASLKLTDEPDVLDAGVDIVARPPGKRLQNISLLSGGEKALTAVTLIFSMLMIKPAPFCLLDEVDAPLDDANIDRFNQMVRSLSSDSQFILVTHNKKTMEMADNLYGITMETPGVSKLISVKLQ